MNTPNQLPARGAQPPARTHHLNRGLIALVAAGGLSLGAVGVAHAAGGDGPTPTTSSTSPVGAATHGRGAPSGTSGPGGDSGDPGSAAALVGPRHGHGPAGRHGHADKGDRARGPHARSAANSDGRISSVDGSRLTVVDQFGRSRTYTIDSDTRVHHGPSTQLGATALSKGEHVRVHGQAAAAHGGDLRALDIDVRAAHLDGQVTAVDNERLTITDRDGFTRQVSITDGTHLRTDGQSTSSKPVVGAVIHAQGRVAGDGTTLEATTVDIRTAAPGRPGDGAAAPGQPAPATPEAS